MTTGNTGNNIRKVDLENSKIATVGFTKTVFYHKATAGQTAISLSSLTMPTEISSNGFSNPSPSTLLNANLFSNQRNLTLVSLGRPMAKLVLGSSYLISSSSQITFINGFVALEGEIFEGTIDYNPTNGVRVVDGRQQVWTGQLAAGATDITIGDPFLTNKNSSYQVGAVRVILDGLQQYRNVGNSVSGEGNYYEVPVTGSQYSSVIRVNTAHPTAIRNYSVEVLGTVIERTDGSMQSAIDNINGQLQTVATYVAAATGQTTTTVLGAAPSNQDLKAFGDRVVALETRANVDETPTLQSDVIATRLGQKEYLANTAYANGTLTVTWPANLNGSRGIFIPYQLQDGSWRMRFNISFKVTVGTTGISVAVSGITFGNASPGGDYQACTSASNGGTSNYGLSDNTSNTIRAFCSGAATSWTVSGDVELLSKPTWAF